MNDKSKMVDGGNFWYQPGDGPEPMKFGELVLIVVILAACTAVIYGAVRYFGALAFGWPV